MKFITDNASKYLTDFANWVGGFGFFANYIPLNFLNWFFSIFGISFEIG